MTRGWRLGALLLGLVVTPAWAGGSLGTDDLAPLLRQRPKEMAAIRAEYELSDAAFAWVRLGPHFPHLAGERVGPYQVKVHRRAAQESHERILWICTKARYLDSRGRELPERAIFDAVRVKETITAIRVQDANAPQSCPH